MVVIAVVAVMKKEACTAHREVIHEAFQNPQLYFPQMYERGVW
jgi:hypothetical protein